jgi:hypothetical protein
MQERKKIQKSSPNKSNKNMIIPLKKKDESQSLANTRRLNNVRVIHM